MYKASCHCGNVALDTAVLPESLTNCNCSICNRVGALWGYYAPEEVSVSVKDGATSQYVWGDREIALHRCPNCGCVTHYTTTKKSKSKRIAINFRMMSLEIIDSIPVKRFDGAVTWRYLED